MTWDMSQALAYAAYLAVGCWDAWRSGVPLQSGWLLPAALNYLGSELYRASKPLRHYIRAMRLFGSPVIALCTGLVLLPGLFALSLGLMVVWSLLLVAIVIVPTMLCKALEGCAKTCMPEHVVLAMADYLNKCKTRSTAFLAAVWEQHVHSARSPALFLFAHSIAALSVCFNMLVGQHLW